MSGPVFVHAGLAKTGTTTLQQNVFSKADGVAYLGKNLVPPALMEANRQLTRLAEGRFDAAAARAVYDGYRQDRDGVAVFSDEDLSVWKFLDPAVMGARLPQVFGAHRLIYVTRRPRDWVASQYFFRLSTWRPDTLAGINPWLERHLERLEVGSDVAEIRFTDTLQRLHHGAGEPEVLVLAYEAMAQDAGGFLGRIEAFMGLAGQLRAFTGAATMEALKTRMSKAMANFIRSPALLEADRDGFVELAKSFARRGGEDCVERFRELKRAPDATRQDWTAWLRSAERGVRRGLLRGDEALTALLDGLFDDYAIDPALMARVEAIGAEQAAAMRSRFGVDLSAWGYGG